MHSSEDVISKIIDIDSRAEGLKNKAKEDIEVIKSDLAKKKEQELKALEKRIADKNKQINDAAENMRNSEVEKIREEFFKITDSIKNTPEDKIEKAVNIILTRIKGISE